MKIFLRFSRVALWAGILLITVLNGPVFSDDQEVLQTVIDIGKARRWDDNIITRISHLDPNSGGQLPGSCVTSSMDFGNALAAEFETQGYAGWRIQQVTNWTGGHTALALTSPEGKSYYVDNYFFNPDIQPAEKIDSPYNPGTEAYLPNTNAQYTSAGTLLLPGEWLPTAHGIDITIDGSSTTSPSGITPGSGIPEGKTKVQVGVRASVDPNQKNGPSGYGDKGYTRGDTTFTYTVAFENLSTAEAAAQTVLVTDVLDNRLDLATLQPGAISFGNNTLMPFPGQMPYEGYVDLRPARNMGVKVEAALDNSTRTLTWKFSSLDPVTMKPLDPASTDGFLPPNVTAPEGQGYVTFLISPVGAVVSENKIKNKASITFDTNAPILTNEWLNTIDRDKPQSAVTPLTASTRAKPDGSILVSWTGSDGEDGSGIQGYDVFAKKEGDPGYALWLNNTGLTSGRFPYGEAGRTFDFFCVATDNAGNKEDFPLTPDASTKVLPSGDIDGDGDVDSDDLNILLRDRNKTVENCACGIECDLDGDGKITVLDGRVLVTVCTRARCATK